MEISVPYVIYDNAGTILQVGHCLTSSLTLQASQGRNVTTGVAGLSTHYVLSGNVVPYSDAELQAKNNLPRGFVWKMPERITTDTRTLPNAQSQAWERIKAARTIKESLPFTCNGSVYDSNVPKISGAALSALMAQLSSTSFSIDWTLYDNTVKTLDAAGMIAVGNAQASAINSVYETARTLRAAIQACTTNAQADAITWPT